MRDTSKARRSLAKAISWETISFFLTMGITYLFTGDVRMSIELSSVCLVIKTIIFFLHERAWHQVKWGKLDNQLDGFNHALRNHPSQTDRRDGCR